MNTGHFERIQRPLLGVVGLGFGGVWFVLIHEWEIPLYINTAMWAGIFAVLFWFVIRPMFLPTRLRV